MPYSFAWSTGSGIWNVGTNWISAPAGGSGPPGPLDGATISSSGGTITLPGTASDAFFGGSPVTLTGGTLDLTNDTPSYASAGVYALDVEDNLTLANASIDTRNGGEVGSPIAVGGDFVIGTQATLYAGSTNSAQPAVAMGAGGTLDVNGGVVQAAGTVEIKAGGVLDMTGGTIDPSGTTSVLLDPGSAFNGYGLIAGALNNDISFNADGGFVEIAGPVTGAGELAIDPFVYTTLQLDSSVGSGQSVYFNFASGRLNLGDPGAFDAFIGAWRPDQIVDLLNVGTAGASDSYDPSTGTLSIVVNHASYALNFGAGFTEADFTLQTDSAGTGAQIVDVSTPCFAQGTRIRTARGLVAVEDLCTGDCAVTRAGRRAPIAWIGHRRLACI